MRFNCQQIRNRRKPFSKYRSSFEVVTLNPFLPSPEAKEDRPLFAFLYLAILQKIYQFYKVRDSIKSMKILNIDTKLNFKEYIL